jgi:CRISPR-associated protein Csm2
MEKQQTTFDEKFDPKWITDGLDRHSIEYASKLGKYLKDNGFTTSQIRNVYGEVKRIELNGFEKNYASFLLLQPKLAYAAVRAERSNNKDRGGAKAFKERITELIKQVIGVGDVSSKRFNNFCQLFEAILAYHKANGGN